MHGTSPRAPEFAHFRRTRHRKVRLLFSSWLLVVLFLFAPLVAQERDMNGTPDDRLPLVIAHRGASGYLPEHTLAAKAMAHAMDCDYLEQDVVLCRDGIPIVLHDIHLDAVTDVARQFPGRARKDGRFYAIDFGIEEIRRLRVGERVDWRTGQPVFPSRFPAHRGLFQIPTLEEELQLIQGLNQATGRDVGIYVELKAPTWHREQGFDLGRAVWQVLQQQGYRDRDDRVFLQCFEVAENRRLREELHCPLRLIQLLGGEEHDALRTPEGLRRIADYADGIGPRLSDVLRANSTTGPPVATSLATQAHAEQLWVHPYTLRADDLPPHADSFAELIDQVVDLGNVDGFFTDFPDQARFRLEQRRDRSGNE